MGRFYTLTLEDLLLPASPANILLVRSHNITRIRRLQMTYRWDSVGGAVPGATPIQIQIARYSESTIPGTVTPVTAQPLDPGGGSAQTQFYTIDDEVSLTEPASYLHSECFEGSHEFDFHPSRKASPMLSPGKLALIRSPQFNCMPCGTISPAKYKFWVTLTIEEQ